MRDSLKEMVDLFDQIFRKLRVMEMRSEGLRQGCTGA